MGLTVEAGQLLRVSLCLQWLKTAQGSADGPLKESRNDRFPIWKDQLMLRRP
jgi:hypothetical protein